MEKPSLVIMAAGMGSRFGGLKQMTPVDPQGHFLMDYSVYDAIRAGFGKVVCVIREEMREDFEAKIGSRVRPFVELAYVYQSLDRLLPEGFAVPEGRTKPWGTAHAVLCAAEEIHGPFTVINADDFYGREAYAAMAKFLQAERDETEHAMVGYELEKTLSDHGSVSRGQCLVDGQGCLVGITERAKIIRTDSGAAWLGDDGTPTPMGLDSVVSMNIWGFQQSVLPQMQAMFRDFLTENRQKNPLMGEFYLPMVAGRLLQNGSGTIRVLTCDASWYGITYKDDLPKVINAIADLKAAGHYPEELWK